MFVLLLLFFYLLGGGGGGGGGTTPPPPPVPTTPGGGGSKSASMHFKNSAKCTARYTIQLIVTTLDTKLLERYPPINLFGE